MNSHELARRLLELADGPVMIDGDGEDITAVWAASWGELTTVYLEIGEPS
jgi:hypothetical protein